MPTYAVGDLQGCLNSFERLLERLEFAASTDRLWLCGDLINRGPKSLETLRRVRALADCSTVVLGNHDLSLLAVAEGCRSLRSKDTIGPILDAPDRDELLHWLRHQPVMHHDVTLGKTMVHAGLAPQWDLAAALACAGEVQTALRGDNYREFLANMYGDSPNRWHTDLSGMERLRFITNAFTRIRFCSLAGDLSMAESGPPGSQPADLIPWFQVPGRRSRDLQLVFGHWAALGNYREAGIDAIDSGCVWGGRLTALQLDGAESGRIVSVACVDNDDG